MAGLPGRGEERGFLQGSDHQGGGRLIEKGHRIPAVLTGHPKPQQRERQEEGTAPHSEDPHRPPSHCPRLDLPEEECQPLRVEELADHSLQEDKPSHSTPAAYVRFSRAMMRVTLPMLFLVVSV